jgi:tubulin-specific chaperone A
MATLRSLKIKTSRCKQSVEELHTYEQEVEREAATVAYLRDKGDDPHWLKQEVCLNIVFFKGSC